MRQDRGENGEMTENLQNIGRNVWSTKVLAHCANAREAHAFLPSSLSVGGRIDRMNFVWP